MVERCVRDAEVGGSNPLTPTTPPQGLKRALGSILGVSRRDFRDLARILPVLRLE